jgi:chemotaxis protein CheD
MDVTHVVGVGDCMWSTDPHATLVTYALGSCIAVTVYEPFVPFAALLHFMLPGPGPDVSKGEQRPWMFASTGVPLLLARAAELGVKKPRMSVHLIGGAQVLDDSGFFSIGKKNHVEVRKILWREGVLVKGEAVGGTECRSVWLHVGTGRLRLKQGARPAEELERSHEGVSACLSAS